MQTIISDKQIRQTVWIFEFFKKPNSYRWLILPNFDIQSLHSSYISNIRVK